LIKNYAIIPVREFDESKQRLGGVLTPKERADLTFALLLKIVSQLQLSKVDKIIMVAADDTEVRSALPSLSKLEIVKESVHHGGVNSAMRDGLQRTSTSSSKVLLLPSDLPLITSSVIDKALDSLDVNELIINPSIRKDGTNLLGFWRNNPIELHYDDDSVAKHLREIEKMKLRFLLLEWKEFQIDVDDAEDLNYLMNLYAACSFENLIEKIRNGADTQVPVF
jgi:2-phospho-L-lactate guanylyltransferase